MERLCCAKFCANALHALRSISKGAERLVKVIWGLPFSSNPNAIGWLHGIYASEATALG